MTENGAFKLRSHTHSPTAPSCRGSNQRFTIEKAREATTNKSPQSPPFIIDGKRKTKRQYDIKTKTELSDIKTITIRGFTTAGWPAEHNRFTIRFLRNRVHVTFHFTSYVVNSLIHCRISHVNAANNASFREGGVSVRRGLAFVGRRRARSQTGGRYHAFLAIWQTRDRVSRVPFHKLHRIAERIALTPHMSTQQHSSGRQQPWRQRHTIHRSPREAKQSLVGRFISRQADERSDGVKSLGQHILPSMLRKTTSAQ